jgi:hypothetical protein
LRPGVNWQLDSAGELLILEEQNGSGTMRA